MGSYPVCLELAGQPCLVIGGGPIAERKVEGLLAAGAAVTVVSPSLTPGLVALARGGRIRHLPREYGPGDVAGSRLALAATGKREVDAAASREGRERGVWVNAADDPELCDFTLPATLRRGDLVVAVSTGGASPALARAVREELEGHLPESYAALADIVAEVRRELRQRTCSPGGEAWRRALDADLRRLVAEGRREEAKASLLARLAPCP
jgi:precorrin-2 dehydrogenase/sirohydrochlorin ferrochelatase